MLGGAFHCVSIELSNECARGSFRIKPVDSVQLLRGHPYFDNAHYCFTLASSLIVSFMASMWYIKNKTPAVNKAQTVLHILCNLGMPAPQFFSSSLLCECTKEVAMSYWIRPSWSKTCGATCEHRQEKGSLKLELQWGLLSRRNMGWLFVHQRPWGVILNHLSW